MKIEVVTRPISEWCIEERHYVDGKLVEVRRTQSPRAGSLHNTMKIHNRSKRPGTQDDTTALTGA